MQGGRGHHALPVVHLLGDVHCALKDVEVPQQTLVIWRQQWLLHLLLFKMGVGGCRLRQMLHSSLSLSLLRHFMLLCAGKAFSSSLHTWIANQDRHDACIRLRRARQYNAPFFLAHDMETNTTTCAASLSTALGTCHAALLRLQQLDLRGPLRLGKRGAPRA